MRLGKVTQYCGICGRPISHYDLSVTVKPRGRGNANIYHEACYDFERLENRQNRNQNKHT